MEVVRVRSRSVSGRYSLRPSFWAESVRQPSHEPPAVELQALVERFEGEDRDEGVAELREVPQGDLRLVAKQYRRPRASGRVGGPAGIEVAEPAVGAP